MMLAEIGTLSVVIALAATLYTPFAIYWSTRRKDRRWMQSGYNGIYAAAALLGLALLLLLFAFLDDQFQIQYVFQNSSSTLPVYLKVSALWAGQNGSLLLWSFLQALFAALVVRPAKANDYDHRTYIPWAGFVLALISAFFTGVTLFLSNPFTLLDSVPPDGQGLNPLLRHPGMIFHPPALYLGYVGLAVPFAFAMAALITGRTEGWTRVARRWTLAAWLFLGVGLLLGARWAYDVLGWGGYWGWDPVENAGLMPWLTGTALLHASVMQDERRGFVVWNFLLAILSFTLVLFGTFATRSGMIQSVHAFGHSPLGFYFLGFIIVTLIGSLLLLFFRRSALKEPPALERFLSRPGLFLITLILFITLTGSVFVGSVLPTLTDALVHRQFEAGPAWFDRVTGPQFGALLLVLAGCPILGRTGAVLARLRQRGWPALAGMVAVPAVAALAGLTNWVSLAGFGLVGLAGGTAAAEIVQGLARREGLAGLWRAIRRAPRRYGGYLVHIGVALISLGIIGTRMYPLEAEAVLSLGESAEIGRYTLVLEDTHQEEGADNVSLVAIVSAYRDGDYLTTLTPRLNEYDRTENTMAIPALRAGLKEDLYVVLAGYTSHSITLKVFVNTLASFLWLGGLVFLAGGAVAVWPAPERKRLPAPQARRRMVWEGMSLLIPLLVLLAAGVAMWGPGHGATARPTGRPMVGQPAPDFTLTLLDGSTLSLSDLRGQVAVVNFWASWCPPCVDEAPALQAVWEEYQDQGMVLVGIVYQDDLVSVQRFAASNGLTYPIGTDVESEISTAYGITGIPETFVVDREGNVAFIHVGPLRAEELSAELDTLLDSLER